MDDLLIHADRNYMGDISLYVRDGDFFAQPPLMVKREEGEIVDPAMKLTSKAAQALMDDLWRCGVRPAEAAGSEGALTATQAHLRDMRKLTAKVLEVDL